MSRHGPGGYDKVLAVIHAARTSIRRSEAVKGAAWTVLAGGACLLSLVLLDNLFHLPSWIRVVLLTVAVGVVGVVVLRTLVRPSSRKLTEDAVAVRIEEASGTTDNSLINALQLGREHRRECDLSQAIVRSVVGRGASSASRFSPARAVNRRLLGRALGYAGGALLCIVCYALLFDEHFANAMDRYFPPTDSVPPLPSTRLSVDPGDARVPKGASQRVTVRAEGEVLRRARIHVRTEDGSTQTMEMKPGMGGCSFTFDRIDEPLEYHIEGGDDVTDTYRITLLESIPVVAGLTLTSRLPAYLGQGPVVEEDATGDIRALVGTTVTVQVEMTRPIRDARISLRESSVSMVRSGESTFRGRIVVPEEQDQWSLAFDYPSGKPGETLGNPNPELHDITPIPDTPPKVTISAPGKNVTVTLPARVRITIEAEDDFGLAGEIHLATRRGGMGDTAIVRRWPANGETKREVSYVFDLREGDVASGGVIEYYAVARDAYPSPGVNPALPPRRLESRSKTYRITVQSRPDWTRDAARALASLATSLRDLLEREEVILKDTVELRSQLTRGSLRLSSLSGEAENTAAVQSVLGAEMKNVGESVPTDVRALASTRSALLSLAANEVIETVRRLKSSGGQPDEGGAKRDLEAASETETRIVVRLKALLGQVEALLNREKENPEGWVDETMDEADPEAALRNALAKLKKFIREQEEILEHTRKLENKEVDDFTDEDLALLEKLAAQESELSRFLEDLKDDLSKIPDQDFSNSMLLKELIEAYSEVELAADALTRKSVELAVPHEQSGLELAESLTENIEKWLPDVRDNLKWNMEEMEGEYPDVPMADLPDQLEDLIGDLIESEEQLGEDADDVTAGWADSLDKGAGWGVMDGPISNMSAQGKTGNTLPNSSEIGGRSGEGRTGRSHGEMVESEATGKGGRRTPTRLTPDPWEGKAVKDSSTDPLGGATGGGKLSGSAGGGLRGPLPPEVKGDLGRLHGNQMAIRQKAERLDRLLKSLQYPSEDLSRSIVLMKDLEGALQNGDMPGFRRQHRVLIEQMKEEQGSMMERARLAKDRSRAVPKEILREMESVDFEGLPKAYLDLLKEYFKILSTGGDR